MAIEPVEVEFLYSSLRKRNIQVSRRQEDGLLLLKEDPEEWIQSNPGDLLYVRFLELQRVENIGDSIGTLLSQLTHLSIDDGKFECLPNSISSLPFLQRLELHTCEELQELPANLGELNSLTSLTLGDCTSIKSLPHSISKLSNLTSLILNCCFSLEELPANSNVEELLLYYCESIQSLPEGLCSLKQLRLTDCPLLTELPTDLNILQLLDIKYCCSIQSLPKCLTNLQQLQLPLCSERCLANLIYFQSLCYLSFHTRCKCTAHSEELPANLGELSELLTLSIWNTKIKWLPWSITKLSKLRLLSLSEHFRLETLPKHLDDSIVISVKGRHIRKTWEELKTEIQLFSIPIVGHLNLAKLKIDDCTIRSLPRCLQHLEIIHRVSPEKDKCCVQLQECLKQAVNMRTLSVTCYNIEFLPSIARHQTLQVLQFKDCFNLENLPPNLDELVELRTLNVSGTRIKSLPDSITKLQNLQHLILPKCFKLERLPKNFQHQVSVSVDVTDDLYYEDAGYNDFPRISSEDNEITSEFMEGGEQVVLQESTHDSVIEQVSAHSLLKPQPIAAQVDEVPTVSQFSSRTVPINVFSSLHNREMEILLTRNEECGVPLAPNSHYHEMDGHHFVSNMRQVNADPDEREDSPRNGLTDAVGESSSHALCNFQIEEMYCLGTFANDLAAKSSSNLHETNCFSESNQHNFQNGQMDTIYMDVEHRSAEYESTYSVHGGCDDHALDIGQNHNPQSDKVKENKTQKKKIQLECILPLMSQNMRLIDAAKQLDVSRSTLKRILKKNKTKWLSSRKRKQHQDAKSKKHNTKSPCVGKNSSLLNLVDPTNLAGHDHGVEHLNGPNQLTLTDQVPSVSMVRTVAEPPMATQCHKEGHLPVKEHSNDAKECTLLHTVQQPDESSSTFVVKATYNEDTTRFNFSLSSSIEQLKEEAGKRLELEVGKFKMKYQDDDKELVLMSTISDLEHALSLSTSSGSNVVRLSVFSKT